MIPIGRLLLTIAFLGAPPLSSVTLWVSIRSYASRPVAVAIDLDGRRLRDLVVDTADARAPDVVRFRQDLEDGVHVVVVRTSVDSHADTLRVPLYGEAWLNIIIRDRGVTSGVEVRAPGPQ